MTHTGINDVVLVHIDGKPAFFARIEDITPDVKQGWWRVKLLVLTFPLQVYTWILEEAQIDGTPFTMGGTPVVLEKVVCPEKKNVVAQPSPAAKEKSRGDNKIVPLFPRKKDS